jgi:iron complex transport system substrate-binding protein
LTSIMKKAFSITVVILMVLAASFSAFAQQDTITVVHELGEVEVAKNPQTVVVFDYGLLDTVDSFGVKVAGVVKSSLPSYLEKFRADQYVDIGTLFEPNFERIYELQPDLILISARQAEVFEELNRIAPTVYLTIDTSDYWGSFSSNLRLLGEIFDRSELVEAELRGIKEAMDVINAQAAELGASALILMANDGALSAYGPGSRFGVIHKEFGFPAADSNIEVVNHGQNVSFEYLVQVNPDLIFVIDRAATVGGSISAQQVMDNPLVRMLNAHRNDNIYYLTSQVWYTASGGLVGTKIMVEDLEAVFQ